MKIWLSVFALVGLIGVAAAQSGGPEWFVLDNKESLFADVNEEKPISLEDEEPKLEVAPKKSVRVHKFEERLRFAKNGRDLEFANNWLKKEFEGEHTQNILLSPLDFYFSSVLLANGVVDQTLVEFSKMFSVMRLQEVSQQIKSCIKQRSKSTSINLALWGKVFSEHFTELMQKQLGAEIWGLQDTTDVINEWIKARTDGKIGNIIEPESVSENDMLLVSSAYFEAPWLKPISSSKVIQNDAHNLDGETISIQMFQSEQKAWYFEDDEMYAVKLFYDTGDYISLFMPKDVDNFENFVKELTVYSLKPAFERRFVKVTLPKIELEYQSSMIKDVYAMLGIRKIFENGNYEFAKMINFDTVASMKDVVLKAKMKIDEGVTVDEAQNERKVETDLKKAVFNASRPFVFMINDGDFIGTVVKFD